MLFIYVCLIISSPIFIRLEGKRGKIMRISGRINYKKLAMTTSASDATGLVMHNVAWNSVKGIMVEHLRIYKNEFNCAL